jgi:hypothetical protein
MNSDSGGVVHGMVELRAIGCTLPLDEVYEDVPE